MTDTLRIGSLFSGYGGLDLGVKQVLPSATVAWHVEIDPAPSRILAHHWPDVPNHGDVTAVDWSLVEPVDIVTGGFPCQDLSDSGKRAGLRPGTRSGLWAHMAHAIEQLKPRMVVIENVRGILYASAHSDMEPCPWCVGNEPNGFLRALGAVVGNLADIGYDAQWRTVRASDAGACHGRERVFITATRHTTSTRRERGTQGRVQCAESAPFTEIATDPAGTKWGVSELSDICPTTRPTTKPRERSSGLDWGPYAAAIARHADTVGRSAPPPTETGKTKPYLSPRFVEWLMMLPDGHVTSPEIGLSRSAQLRALGNGVVPNQAALALRTMGAGDE